jgi:hypothetical protein
MKNHLLSTFEELLNSVQKEKLQPGEEIYVKQLIYLLEGEIEKVKIKHKLSSYNAKIFSERIAKSFFWVERDLFDYQAAENAKAITAMDYQYWLLVFLLTRYNELYKKDYTLFEIIDKFVDFHKENSLTFADVTITESGATRCKTNLRFAISSLKEMGLVKLYEKEEKEKSWMLTYLGFFTAASICIDPDNRRSNPFTDPINEFHVSRFFKLDHWILD